MYLIEIMQWQHVANGLTRRVLNKRNSLHNTVLIGLVVRTKKAKIQLNVVG